MMMGRQAMAECRSSGQAVPIDRMHWFPCTPPLRIASVLSSELWPERRLDYFITLYSHLSGTRSVVTSGPHVFGHEYWRRLCLRFAQGMPSRLASSIPVPSLSRG